MTILFADLQWLTEAERKLLTSLDTIGRAFGHRAVFRALIEARKVLDVVEDYDAVCCSVCQGQATGPYTYDHQTVGADGGGPMCLLRDMPRGPRG
jgi:hypothetical protein